MLRTFGSMPPRTHGLHFRGNMKRSKITNGQRPKAGRAYPLRLNTSGFMYYELLLYRIIFVWLRIRVVLKYVCFSTRLFGRAPNKPQLLIVYPCARVRGVYLVILPLRPCVQLQPSTRTAV